MARWRPSRGHSRIVDHGGDIGDLTGVDELGEDQIDQIDDVGRRSLA